MQINCHYLIFYFWAMTKKQLILYLRRKGRKKEKTSPLPKFRFTSQICVNIVDLTYTKCILEGSGMQSLLNLQFSLCSDTASLNHFPLQHDTHVLSFNTWKGKCRKNFWCFEWNLLIVYITLVTAWYEYIFDVTLQRDTVFSSAKFSHSVMSNSLLTPWTSARHASLSITNC